MKSSNRWLIIFGAIIGVLVIVAVTLVLTMKKDTTLLPADTPDGVVQRYIIALKNSDYQTAYTYLSSTAKTAVPFTQWKPAIYYGSNQPTWQATLGKPTITNNTATLDVIIDRFYANNGVLNNSVNSQTITFQLDKESGVWKISQPDYVYFLY